MHAVVESSIGMNFLGISYHQGGGFEADGQRGVSHLMEHLMCRTTDDLREQLRASGITHNAYTSDNRVVFWWSGLDSELKKYSQILYDRITKQEHMWTKEQFENEKKTVLQEYADSFNDQFEGTYLNMMRKFYNYSSAIGYREDIEKFTYEDSLEFATKFKVPERICEVGERFLFDSRTVPKEEVSERLRFGHYSLGLESVPKEDKTIVGLLGSTPLDGNDAAKYDLLMTCLTGGLESPLYTEIRGNRGLSYYSIGWTVKVGNQLVPFFAASTGVEQADELAGVYEEIFNKSFEDIVSKERFDTCKSSLLVSKKIAEILPHSGAKATILDDPNPFTGIDLFTYDEAVALGHNLRHDLLIPIRY